MKCAHCGATEGLTDDHIIPHWLYKRLHILDPLFVKNLGQQNIQMLCYTCNGKKGGRVEWSHPLMRESALRIAYDILTSLERDKIKDL